MATDIPVIAQIVRRDGRIEQMAIIEKIARLQRQLWGAEYQLRISADEMVSLRDRIASQAATIYNAEKGIVRMSQENSELRLSEIKANERAEIAEKDAREANDEIIRHIARNGKIWDAYRRMCKFANKLFTENVTLRRENKMLRAASDDAMVNVINHAKEIERLENSARMDQMTIVAQKRAIDETDKIIRSKNNHIREMELWSRDDRRTIKEKEATIRDLQSRLEIVERDLALAQFDGEIECNVYTLPANVFEMIPNFAGFASCGNGCQVLRNESGGFTEIHESHCDMADDVPTEF